MPDKICRLTLNTQDDTVDIQLRVPLDIFKKVRLTRQLANKWVFSHDNNDLVHKLIAGTDEVKSNSLYSYGSLSNENEAYVASYLIPEWLYLVHRLSPKSNEEWQALTKLSEKINTCEYMKLCDAILEKHQKRNAMKIFILISKNIYQRELEFTEKIFDAVTRYFNKFKTRKDTVDLEKEVSCLISETSQYDITAGDDDNSTSHRTKLNPNAMPFKPGSPMPPSSPLKRSSTPRIATSPLTLHHKPWVTNGKPQSVHTKKTSGAQAKRNEIRTSPLRVSKADVFCTQSANTDNSLQHDKFAHGIVNFCGI
jgi:hypothetical protein